MTAPIVLVRLRDALCAAQWQGLSDIEETEAPEMLAVGFLLKESEHTIRLVGLYAPEDESGNAIILLPRGSVESITVLKEDADVSPT